MVTPALYEGTLVHRRFSPDHRFSMSLAMPLLDVDELATVADAHPLWRHEAAGPVSLRRADFLPHPDGIDGEPSIADAVRAVVGAATGSVPSGPVLTLGHVRTWGYVFNPIALYFCVDPSDGSIDQTVAVVTNTPWKESTSYVLGPPGEHRFAKELHVSPFFGMDHDYLLRYSAPDESFRCHIDLLDDDDQRFFHAGLTLRRRPLDRHHMGRMLWRYPLLTARVTLGIHTQALRLWRKGARIHRHPAVDERH